MVLVAALPGNASAEILPVPDLSSPRIQTAIWAEGEEVLLTALPGTGLTVMLEPGERIERVNVESGAAGFEIRVSSERDSLLILPRADLLPARINVETDRRLYPLMVRTDPGLTAALLVRFEYPELQQTSGPFEPLAGPIWSYRIRGDDPVRPLAIRDDATRTYITYAPGQALPAVFARGPAGEEEVVNGYMRSDIYVIDRVYPELVFRIDEERATARRNDEPDDAP